MARYINPFTDAGFKRIFGQEVNMDLLLDFLNALIEPEEPFVHVDFLDKEILPHDTDGRRLIYDIHCRTSTGERILVEMQNATQTYFRDRSLYYMASAISNQGEKGRDWKFSLKKVYGVFFLNFVMTDFPELPLKAVASLRFEESQRPFSDKLRMFYITLPLMTKHEEEIETDFERWIYVLKNMETLTEIPFKDYKKIFGRLEEVSNLAALTPQERQRYDASLKVYRDNMAVLEYAETQGHEKGLARGLAEGLAKGLAEGLEKGLAEGLAKGLAEGLAEGLEKGHSEGEQAMLHTIINRMRAQGYNEDFISAATGVSVEDIKAME